MKNLTILTLFIILFLSSCTYYEHGPTISIKSANTRITGEWELEDIIINDKTDELLLASEKSLTYTFTEEGGIILSQESEQKTILFYTGTWQFNNNKTTLQISIQESDITNNNIQEESDYSILRLTNDELWMSDENCPNRDSEYIIERRYRKK